jgi:hypothetical protein
METYYQIHLNNAIEACITITNDFHLIEQISKFIYLPGIYIG